MAISTKNDEDEMSNERDVTNGGNADIDTNGANEDPFETMMIHWSYNGSNGSKRVNGFNVDNGTNGNNANDSNNTNDYSGNIGASGTNDGL